MMGLCGQPGYYTGQHKHVRRYDLIRKILLTIAHLAVFLATWWCALALMAYNNLFDWHPKFDFYSFIYTTLPFLLLYLSFKIPGALNKKISISISILSIGVTIFFVYTLFTDEVLSSAEFIPLWDHFLRRYQFSPLWFKLLCGMLSILPVVGSVFRLTNPLRSAIPVNSNVS